MTDGRIQMPEEDSFGVWVSHQKVQEHEETEIE